MRSIAVRLDPPLRCLLRVPVIDDHLRRHHRAERAGSARAIVCTRVQAAVPLGAIVLERRRDAAVDIRGAILFGRASPDHPQPADLVQLGPFSTRIGHRDPDTLDKIASSQRELRVRTRPDGHPRSEAEHEDVATVGVPNLVERAMETDAWLHSIQDAPETDLGAGHGPSVAAICDPQPNRVRYERRNRVPKRVPKSANAIRP